MGSEMCIRDSSYAGVVADEPRLLSAPSGAGVKRPSNTVARRFTGEGNRPAPAERARDVDATTMHVVADEAFGTLTVETPTFRVSRGRSGFVFRTCFYIWGFGTFWDRFGFCRNDTRHVSLPVFAPSAATRHVRERAERARVLVNRANDRVSDMGSRHASTSQPRVMYLTGHLRFFNPASLTGGSSSASGTGRTTPRGGRG